MTPPRDCRDFLEDILGLIAKAFAFVDGMDFAAFSMEDKSVYAVVRALEIDGEASKRIPIPVREASS